MPRKAFIKDLEDAVIPGRYVNIVDIRAGADDATVSFTFLSDALPTGVMTIEALVPEVSDYPRSHVYFLFISSNTDNVPATISSALEALGLSLTGRNLLEMLEEVALTMERVISKAQAHNPVELDDDSDGMDEDEMLLEDEEEEEDDQLWSPKSPQHATYQSPTIRDSKTRNNKSSLARIRSDLRAVKSAGFKVGTLGDLDAGGFVCISIRVIKLGISEEAMQAWGLHRKQYLVLLIRFEQSYRTLEQISEGMGTGKNKTEMRVALSVKYKPSINDAIEVFSQVPKALSQSPVGPTASTLPRQSSLENVFIGRPLNDLLRERFTGIVKYRLACLFSWTGAELFFNAVQGKSVSAVNPAEEKYNVADDSGSRALPSLVIADHIAESKTGLNLSLPLVAMQFLLRHFVRCTEFCLVCHCRIQASFEALKPYVCSKPLCLYQYMALGFGPSIEWEILSQPDVVDLLISFCYVGAKHERLREFPVGIDLRVPEFPLLEDVIAGYHHQNYSIMSSARKAELGASSTAKAEGTHASFITRLDAEKMELIFGDRNDVCPLKLGDWLVVDSKPLCGQIHTRVTETILWPVVRLQSDGIFVTRSKSSSEVQTSVMNPKAVPAGLLEARIYVYDRSFDDMSDSQKQRAIVTLLETLPSVEDMKTYLAEKQHGPNTSLKNWRERLSESALNLLRWILASNRSCIVQVDRNSSSSAANMLALPSQKQPSSESPASFGGAEDRIQGMPRWMQFRFAQGHPSKESRFIDCVNEVSTRTGKSHPTLFAWHGSPLSNWHSIVRQGLNFKDTLHGRAYGHGVYMSPLCATSMSYSIGGGASVWPNSRLKIVCALSLNEVVNAPEEYTSRNPHYVVNNIDWIQTRYLFVQTNKDVAQTLLADSTPSQIYEQDPQAPARGENNQPLVIPITAVSKSRRPVISQTALLKSPCKKVKGLKITNQELAEQQEDDAASIVTSEDDIEFLQSSDDEPMPLSQASEPMSWKATIASKPRSVKRRAPEPLETDFVPGSLDFSQLKMLKPPGNASSATTKTLLQALRDTLKVQELTPAHELGWYVHGQDLENVYQWIVELHSFESTLPLAKDMKAVGLTSVVLELRFTNQYPFSPPFVRVIRPRFMPFAQGGGGHVTAGGALCMELLTNDGWLLSTTIESVLLQVRIAMSSTDPRPARLERAGRSQRPPYSYGVAEAVEAFKRACQMHGWTVPKDFDSLHNEQD